MKTILFAGPTGSGKSHTLRLLQEMKRNQDVNFFHEIATEILSSENKQLCEDRAKFQETIARLQLAQLESADHQGVALSIADRGLPDYFVFDEENAKKFFGSLEKAFSFYDYILYFQAFPLEKVSQGNRFRKEASLQEVEEIALRTKKIYEQHPEPRKIFTIPVFSTPQMKALHCAKLINELCNAPVFE